MLERLIDRVAGQAARAADARRERIAQAAAGEAPQGVEATIEGEAVVLSGRALAWRRVVDQAFRAFLETLR
jgi:hypothetical protein